MTLGQDRFREAFEPATREEFLKEQAARALAKDDQKPHRFRPQPGQNKCRVCSKSYAEGDHLPMGAK